MKFLHEYIRFSETAIQDNGYWEIGSDGYLYNANGGRHQYRPSNDDEIIEAEGWDEIIKMTVRDDNEITGWIAPNGEFFGCNARQHIVLAEYVLGMEEQELEDSGYIKIYEVPTEVRIMKMERGEKANCYEAIILKQFATAMQKITLKKKGFTEVTPRRWVL